MNKCEKFDLQAFRWIQISDCRVKCSGSALSVFNNKIIKIGGKLDIFTPCSNIEIYDPIKDKWTEIDYIFENGLYSRLPFLSAACQINRTQLMLVGGSVHDVKTNQVQLIEIKSEDNKAVIVSSKSIVRSGEIYSQLLVEDKSLFAIQNLVE